MELSITNRGFSLIKFKDDNGVICTIQQSSSAMEDKIWLGAAEIGLREMVAGIGWEDKKLSDNFIANNRMHLTRAQVAELIPVLQKFVDTGEI